MGSIAICKILYSPLRTEPSHRAEICSQLVFGELVMVILSGLDWTRIQTEHGYFGWCRSAHLDITQTKYLKEFQKNLPGILVESDRNYPLNGFLESQKLNDFYPRYLIEGCFSFYPGALNSKGLKWNFIKKNPLLDLNKMAEAGTKFLGVPYLWGGKTPLGFDCSGLIQFLFNLNGFSFPRDAWQQAELGEAVIFDRLNPEFEPGTLLFFQRPEKRIHHVALSIGGHQFLHASEWTRIQSFKEGEINYCKDRKNTLVFAKHLKESHLKTLLLSFENLINSASI